MSHRLCFPVPVWILSLSLVAATTGPAAAGGFATARYGGEEGHPASGHPTSIYYNPAGLSLGSGTHLYVEGLFAWRSASYDRPESAISTILDPGDNASGTPRDAVSANAGKASLSNLIAAPFAAVVSDLGVDNLGVGVGLFAPFGGQATWDQNSAYAGNANYPGAVDGVQRWQNISGELRALYITAAAAYRIPSARLSFGAGLNIVSSKVTTLRARNLAGTDDMVSANGSLLEGRSLVEVSGTDLAASAGVIWQPTDVLSIGVSYQSQPGFGTQKLGGTLTNKLGAGPVEASDVYLVQALPDVTRVGVRYLLSPAVELRLQGDYQRWSTLTDQCLTAKTSAAKCAFNPDGSIAAGADSVVVNVRRKWKDTYGVRAGASYWVSPALEVGGSLAFDSNAVPIGTLDPSLMDANKVLANGSVRYRMPSIGVELMASLLHVFYMERTVTHSTDFAAPSRVPDGAGTYNQQITALSLAVGYAF